MKRLQSHDGDSFSLKSFQSATRRVTLRDPPPLCRLPSHSSFASFHATAEEPRLPNYVVPVLYVPKKIITNTSIISTSNINNCEDIEDSSSTRIHNERPMSIAYHDSRKSNTDNRLTESETKIYAKLMENMYGVKTPKEIDLYKGDFNNHRNMASEYYSEDEDYFPKKSPQNLQLESDPGYFGRRPKRSPFRLRPIYSNHSPLQVSLYDLCNSVSTHNFEKPEDSNPSKTETNEKATITEVPLESPKIDKSSSFHGNDPPVQYCDVSLITSHHSDIGPVNIKEAICESKCTQTAIVDGTASTQTVIVDGTASTQTIELERASRIPSRCKIGKNDVRSSPLDSPCFRVVEDTEVIIETDCSDAGSIVNINVPKK